MNVWVESTHIQACVFEYSTIYLSDSAPVCLLTLPSWSCCAIMSYVGTNVWEAYDSSLPIYYEDGGIFFQIVGTNYQTTRNHMPEKNLNSVILATLKSRSVPNVPLSVPDTLTQYNVNRVAEAMPSCFQDQLLFDP
jgi:hypothetical protein